MRLTQPYTPPILPVTHAMLSVDQTIQTSTNTKVLLDVIWFARANDWDIPNNRFICSQAGYYLICMSATLVSPGAGNRYMAGIQLNSNWHSPFASARVGSPPDASLESTDVVRLAVGDIVELWVYHTFGNPRDIRGGLLYRTWLTLMGLL